MPSPPAALLLDWTVDPSALLLTAVAGGLYLAGVRRLGRGRRRWPPARTAAFLLGLAVVVVATGSGLATHDEESFPAHAGQHVLLGMLAPLLLVLGAPVTLALQATSRPMGRVLRRLLHGRPARLVAHPLTGWALFGGTLVAGLYTPLLEASLRHDLVHVSVHGLYVTAGWLFLWPLVGNDPSPWRPPHAARLLLVLAAVPFHSFVGATLTSGDTLLAPGWYDLDGQRLAGGIIWVSGGALGVVASAVVLWTWSQHEQRSAARADAAAG